MEGAGYSIDSDPGLEREELFSIVSRTSYYILGHTFDYCRTFTTITIDAQYVFGDMNGTFPDVYRGGEAGEVYVSSWFPDWTYKVSFSADTGETFRHVYISEIYDGTERYKPIFISDREPGVFYILHRYEIEDPDPWGWHMKLCIEYYRDYGETLEAVFWHDMTKNYTYEEVICDHTVHLESKATDQNSIQLQWLTSADDSFIRGFHIYRNSKRITHEMLTGTTTYTDENLPAGDYEYYVVAYYESGCISDSSNHITQTITLGTGDMENLGEITLYPNPTQDQLNISAPSTKSIANIQVFDLSGKSIAVIVEEESGTINLSHLPAGIYFVQIQTHGGITTKKIVKQ